MERTLIAPGVHLSCDPAEKFNEIFQVMLGVEDAYSQYAAQGYSFTNLKLGE